jgi:hypothetical protein
MHWQKKLYCTKKLTPQPLFEINPAISFSFMTFFNAAYSRIQSKDVLKTLILDGVALAVVFLIPFIADLFHFPFYMIEPMRLMVMISIAHTSRINSYLLAFVLPFFSWVVSGHPEFFKMLIMTAELGINVYLFYLLLKKSDHVFLTMIAAIIISKIICYSSYLVFFSMTFFREEAVPSFLIAQAITTMLFSLYVSIFYKKRSQSRV